MMCKTAENRAVEWRSTTAGFLRNSLKLRRSYGIIGLDLLRSVSQKVSKRAEMPFTKLNGKYQLNSLK